MPYQTSRREFFRTAALAGMGALAAEQAWALRGGSPNGQVAFACVGVGGKGDSDTADAARLGSVVAICDVDDITLAAAQKKYPMAKPYNDYRKMLAEMGRSIDAVTVSTPDHNHAPAAAMAMRMGKHCFCQKPMTHSIWEARKLGELARQMKVQTQMGNQGTADSSLRRNAALVRAGALGAVREVHVWTNRPIWPQGIDRPAPAPVPANLHWELWLGPAKERPYAPGYHTFAWRGWWDFGTGALGDMACHTVNLPFMALDLRDPVSVEAESPGHNGDSYPKWSTIKYRFAATSRRPAVTMTWYDGGKLPPMDLIPVDKLTKGEMPSSGSLIIGDKGKLWTPGDYGGGGVIIGGVTLPEPEYPVSPGHFEEFVRAIKEGIPATSNFPNYAGPLTETILLGNLSVWTTRNGKGQKVDWDARNLSVRSGQDVAQVLRPMYRTGYTL